MRFATTMDVLEVVQERICVRFKCAYRCMTARLLRLIAACQAARSAPAARAARPMLAGAWLVRRRTTGDGNEIGLFTKKLGINLLVEFDLHCIAPGFLRFSGSFI